MVVGKKLEEMSAGRFISESRESNKVDALQTRNPPNTSSDFQERSLQYRVSNLRLGRFKPNHRQESFGNTPDWRQQAIEKLSEHSLR